MYAIVRWVASACFAVALCVACDDGEDGAGGGGGAADAGGAGGGADGQATEGGCPNGLRGVTEGDQRKGTITFTFRGVERTLCASFANRVADTFVNAGSSVFQPENDPSGAAVTMVNIVIQTRLAVGTHTSAAGTTDDDAQATVGVVVGDENFITGDPGFGSFTVTRSDAAGIEGTFDVTARGADDPALVQPVSGSFDLRF